VKCEPIRKETLSVDIAILGAGAMGQVFGARLQLAGNQVTFIDAAPATIDALNQEGITLTTADRHEHVEATAGTAGDFTGPFDLIIVFTKGFHTASALDGAQHLIGPQTCGLTLQNGLGNGETLARYFGPGRTWVGITDFPADLERPGAVTTRGEGKVLLGPLQAGAVPPRLDLPGTLNAAGLNAAVPEDIQAAIWEKVAFNAALNSVSALTGQTVGEMAAAEESRQLVHRVLDETAAVARARGVSLERDRVGAAVDHAFAHHRDHKSSMLQDRLAGRPTEVDFIGGAVVRLGGEAGVPTPVLWTLCHLIRLPAAGSLRPALEVPSA
jgi:2-dehydropantoate 2-reductase